MGAKMGGGAKFQHPNLVSARKGKEELRGRVVKKGSWEGKEGHRREEKGEKG